MVLQLVAMRCTTPGLPTTLREIGQELQLLLLPMEALMLRPCLPWAARGQWLSMVGVLREAHFWETEDSSDEQLAGRLPSSLAEPFLHCMAV